jgi:hypothetical protein
MRFDSGLGNGTARGFADLPAWLVDVNGEMHLAANAVSGLLTGAAGSQQPPVLPFWLRGPLDAPDVRVDTSSLTGAIRIPGLDKLSKKKGIGKVLDALGGQTQPPETSSPETPSPGTASTDGGATPERRPSPLEDVLKGLLKNR